MAILIATTFVVLTLCNYRTRRDLRYPPFLASGLWLIVLTLYILSPIPVYSISVLTVLIFVVAVLSFSGGGQLALALSATEVQPPKKTNGVSSYYPSIKKLLLLASVVLLPVLFMKANLLAEQSGIPNWLVGLRVEL